MLHQPAFNVEVILFAVIGGKWQERRLVQRMWQAVDPRRKKAIRVSRKDIKGEEIQGRKGSEIERSYTQIRSHSKKDYCQSSRFSLNYWFIRLSPFDPKDKGSLSRDLFCREGFRRDSEQPNGRKRRLFRQRSTQRRCPKNCVDNWHRLWEMKKESYVRNGTNEKWWKWTNSRRS